MAQRLRESSESPHGLVTMGGDTEEFPLGVSRAVRVAALLE